MTLKLPLFAVSGTLLLLAVSGCNEKKAVQKPLPSVIAAPVAEETFTREAVQIGEVASEDSVDLVARVSGFLKEANFKEGSHVKAGTVLFLIDPSEYEASLKKAQGELDKARADKKNADIEFDRQKTLYEKNAVSKKDYDRADASKLEADASVISAEAAVRLAELNLEYTKIVAPFDGWIGFKKYSVGNMVGTSGSTVLATIERSGRAKVNFNLSDLDMMRLEEYTRNAKDKTNVPVRIFDQLNREIPLKGKLNAWDNKVNATTGTIKLQAIFDDPDRLLLPGMFIREVRLRVAKPEEVLMVRESAVTNDVAGSSVMLVTDVKDNKTGKVERRYIKVSGKSDGKLIVSEGLKAGDLIIVSGLQKVRPGAECQFTVEGQNPGAAASVTTGQTAENTAVKSSAILPAEADRTPRAGDETAGNPGVRHDETGSPVRRRHHP